MEGVADIENDAITALNQMMTEGADDEMIMTEEQYMQGIAIEEGEAEGEGDPMDVDEDVTTATIAETIPISTKEVAEDEEARDSTEKNDEKVNADQDEEPDGEVKNLSSLLGEFDTRVIGTIEDMDESTRDVLNCRSGVNEWLEKLVREANILAQSVPSVQRLPLNDAETHVREHLGSLFDAVAMNNAKIKLCYENIRLFVAGVILQLSKGSQHAPFLVHRPLEDIDIGFSTDNPALPANQNKDKLPYIETLRAPIFDDSSSDEEWDDADDEDFIGEEQDENRQSVDSMSDSSEVEEDDEEEEEGEGNLDD